MIRIRIENVVNMCFKANRRKSRIFTFFMHVWLKSHVWLKLISFFKIRHLIYKKDSHMIVGFPLELITNEWEKRENQKNVSIVEV